MPEPTTIVVPTVASAIVLAIVKWLGGREIDRIDKKLSIVDRLVEESATRDDVERALNKTENTLVSAITALRGDIIERVGEVRHTAEKANSRMDDWMRSERTEPRSRRT